MARHVRKAPYGDVQCMLLWSEWVRFYMRERKKGEFPEQIRLKTFNEMVHRNFSPSLAYDDVRGPLYVGIRFVR